MPRPRAREEQLLSPSEWQVFYLVSKRSPLTVGEIAQELGRIDPSFSPHFNTVMTFVRRLQDKGYLRKVSGERGRELSTYEPSVPYEIALRRHVHRFFDQFALGRRGDLETVRRMVEEQLAALPGTLD
jgi:predicted transcriptional regulator